MFKPKAILRSIVTAVLLCLSVTAFLLASPAAVNAGTIAGNFVTLHSSPMNITAFTVDPATGLMYGQGDRSTNYYLYNPTTDAWSALTSCPYNSGNNAGAVCLNGKVYIGYTGSTTVEVYDIAGNSWSSISGGVMTGAIATDGTDIYMSGSGSFKKYSVSSGTWTTLAAGTTQPWGGLQYNGGYFYSDDGNGTMTFKRYNVSTDTWENLSSVPGGAVLGSAIFDAYYYCMGSYTGTNLYSYDLGAASWNNTLTLPFQINDASIVVYNKALYIIQGEQGSGFSKFTPNNPILSGIEPAHISYTVGNAPATITSTIAGSDNDDTNWQSGTVSITNHFQSGKDVLSFTDQNGITGSYNATTGVLTLTGDATIANWMTAFQSVTYSNNANSSTQNTRTIAFQVRDDEQNSNVQSRFIDVIVPVPDIDVKGNTVSIINGAVITSGTNNTNFGRLDVDHDSAAAAFTIGNTGTTTLNLTGNPKVAVSGEDASDFNVTIQPADSVSVGGSTSFSIEFNPSSTGLRTATVSITSDDPDENPFTFTVQGRGTKVLTVTGITADNKEYDGTTAAAINTSGAALVGVTEDDNVTLVTASATGVFANKNAGTGKTVIISGLTISGEDIGDYSLTQPSTTADITVRALTVKAINNSKVYDGTIASAGAPTLTSGALAPGDSVTWIQNFDNKNVGTNKTLTPSGTVTDGNSGNNYNVTFMPIATGTITRRALTVTAASDIKQYDGSIGSTGIPTITVGSLAAGDSVSWTQSFNNKLPDTNKTLTPAGIVTDGNSGNNYDVTYATVDTGTVTARNITVTAVADSKTYDGSINSSGVPAITTGSLVEGDSAAWTQTFSNKGVGINKTLTPAGSVSDGADGANYHVTFVSVSTGTITSKTLTVTGITASGKQYDAAVNAGLNTAGAALSGIVEGDTVTLNTASAAGAFSDKNVGTGKNVTVSGLTIGGSDAGNYTLTQPVTTANITVRIINVKALNNSKTYDGTTASSGVPTITSGALADGDSAVWTQIFNNRNVGTNKTLTPSGTVTDGNSGNNYSVTFTPVYTGTITTRAITVTAGSDTRGYDGTTSSTGVPTITFGTLAAGDSVVWTQTFNTKTAETNKTLMPAGTVNDGNNGENYIVTYASVDTGVITARSITVTAVTDSKTYDGTTSSSVVPTITAGSLSEGDNASWTQTFSNKNAGLNKTLIAAGTISDGNGGSNYIVTFVPVSTGTINKKELTVTGITADNKQYDGNTTATLHTGGASLVGVVAGDIVNLNKFAAAGAFADRNVGIGKTVTISGLTLGSFEAALLPANSPILQPANKPGGDYSNYYLTQPTTTADITARNITVSAVTDGKEYDGTTSSTGVPALSAGTLASGDTVTWSQTFDDKNAGTNKSLSPAGTVVDGNGGYNYAVTYLPTATGTITAKALTVTAVTDSKTYDGTASSIGIPTLTAGALVEGDNVTWSQTFDNKNAGTGKTLTPAGIVSDGNSGNNYSVTFTAVTTGMINVRAITVTANADSRIYNGTNSSSVLPTISTGSLATGDTATWSQTFNNKNVGEGKILTPAGTINDGNTGNNYDVTFTSVSTGTITVKAITVTGITANNKQYDATTGATINVSGAALVGVVPGDSVTLNTGAAVGTFADKTVGNGKTVNISGLNLNALRNALVSNDQTLNNPETRIFDDSANYSLTQPTATANITAKTLTVTGITANNKQFDNGTSATIITSGAALVGVMPGDNVTLNTAAAAGTFIDKNVGYVKLVYVSGLRLGGTDNSNYTLTQPTATANIVEASSGGGFSPPAPTTTTPTTTPTTTTTTSTTTTTTTTTPVVVTTPRTTTTTTTTTAVTTTTAATSTDNVLVINLMGSESSVAVNPAAQTNKDALSTNAAQNVSLEVQQGTTAQNADGSRVSKITVDPLINAPPVQADANMVQGFQFGPSGATFSKPLVLTINYDPATLAPGTNEDDLYIATWDGTAWQRLPCIVDKVNHTVTANISHFSVYALLNPSGVISNSTTAAVLADKASVNSWVLVGIIGGGMIIILLVLFLVLRKSKKAEKGSN